MFDTPYMTKQLEAIREAKSEAEKQRLISDLVKKFASTTLSVSVDNLKDSTSIDNFDEVKAHLRNELRPLLKVLKDLNISSKDQGKIARNLEKKSLDVLKNDFDMVLVRKPKTVDVVVKNINDTPTIKDISINNLKDYSGYFEDLKKTIQDTFNINIPEPKVNVEAPIVNVPETKIDIPKLNLKPIISELKKSLEKIRLNNAKKPLAVRLSDGEEFIEALKTISEAQRVYFDGSSNSTPILKDIKSNTKQPSSINSGSKDVTTAGSSVALANSTSCKEVIITAKSTNTGKIYVGGSSVSSTSGAYIYAGATMRIDIDNLNKVYIDADTDGEGVQFTYVS